MSGRRFWVGVGFALIGMIFYAWHSHAHEITVAEAVLHSLPFLLALALMLPVRYWEKAMDTIAAVFGGRRP